MTNSTRPGVYARRTLLGVLLGSCVPSVAHVTDDGRSRAEAGSDDVASVVDANQTGGGRSRAVRVSELAATYRAVSGERVLERESIGYGMWKEGLSLERFADGTIRFGERRYVPTEDATGD